MSTIFDQGLEKNQANFTALSPISFLERSAEVFGDLPAVIHGQRRYNWAQTRERSARLAAALNTITHHRDGFIFNVIDVTIFVVVNFSHIFLLDSRFRGNDS